jgi:hypothetical protein
MGKSNDGRSLRVVAVACDVIPNGTPHLCPLPSQVHGTYVEPSVGRVIGCAYERVPSLGKITISKSYSTTLSISV